MSKRTQSDVYGYFTRNSENGKGECKQENCQELISWHSSALKKHLKRKHSEAFQQLHALEKAGPAQPSGKKFCTSKSSFNLFDDPGKKKILKNALVGAGEIMEINAAQVRPGVGKRKRNTSDFTIADFLEGYDSRTKTGRCKKCFSQVPWTKARVSSHNRVTCTEASDKERKIFSKRKLEEESSSSELSVNYKPKKRAPKCFICNEYSTVDRKQLTTVLSSSRTPLYKTLELFTGVELSLDTINYSEACQDCASSIETYDNFVHLSTQIQKNIADKFHSTHSQQVFIKGEPEFEIVNVVENMNCSTSFQEITKLEPLKLVDDNEPTFELENYPEETDGDNSQEPLPSTSLFECDKCDQKLVNRVSLADHLKTHVSSKTRWKCDKCSLNYQAEGSLEIHKILSHSENSPKHFTCPICDKAFEGRETFRNHYDQHKPTKNFLCNRCGTVFKNKKYYNRHMMIHDDNISNRDES